MALFSGCAAPGGLRADFLDGRETRFYRTISGRELRVEKDGTVLDVTCPPDKSEALCAGEKAQVLGRAMKVGADWDMAPYAVAPETGCKRLLRYLSLDGRDERRHSCWNRLWEVPAAAVAYPAAVVVLAGVVTAPVWVPLIMLR